MKILNAFISSLLLLCVNVIGLTKAQAQPQGFQFKKFPVTLSGNGCPTGSAEGIFDGDTLRITFSKFEAQALSPRVISKSCNLRVGLEIPSGYKLKPINLKYVGFAHVPKGGSAALNVKIIFQGKNVPVQNDSNTTFKPGFSSTWEKNIVTRPDAIDACTRTVSSVFGINTVLIARASNVATGHQTKLTIDKGYEIKFTFTPCR